jgi:hypothetical protein
MLLLCQVLKKNGTQIGTATVSKMIKTAAYKLRKAKVVLTSIDPTYGEKLARIYSILSNLRPNEAFFSIDEYGPFAIKTKPGRMLVPPGGAADGPAVAEVPRLHDHDGGVGTIRQSGYAFL